MECDKNGVCRLPDKTFLESLADFILPGAPLSAFLLAINVCFCIIFLISIPSIRKNAIFGMLCIIFAPFLVKTINEVIYFGAIHTSTSSYYAWGYYHSQISSFCYTSFLFSFEYGMCYYAIQCIRIAKSGKDKNISLVYILIFFISVLFSFFMWQIIMIGIVSLLLILVLAPIVILVVLIYACCCVRATKSGSIYSQSARSLLLWNIPCLLLTMIDSLVQIYKMVFKYHDYEGTTNIEKITIYIWPTIVILSLMIFLPSFRRVIFVCCYSHHSSASSDLSSLLPRSVSALSDTSSERTSVSTISSQTVNNQIALSHTNLSPNIPAVPQNAIAPVFHYISVPTVYSNQGMTPQHPQHVFMPVPVHFMSPHQVPNQTLRISELPIVQ